MLEHLITQVRAAHPSYVHLNDRLCYVDYIDRRYTYDEVTVAPLDAYRFQGNVLGLFKHIGVEDKLLSLALYLNGFTNPVQFDGLQLTFRVPKAPPISET